MKLTFTTGTKDVPVLPKITRKLLTEVTPHINDLRKAGQNNALTQAVAKNPRAVGYLTGSWLEEKRAAMVAAYPNADEKHINMEVQKALAAALTEEFPEVWQAMTNPETSIEYDNDDSLKAAFGVCRTILDTGGLNETEMTELDADGFWDEQDLEEVVKAVGDFRSRAKL